MRVRCERTPSFLSSFLDHQYFLNANTSLHRTSGLRGWRVAGLRCLSGGAWCGVDWWSLARGSTSHRHPQHQTGVCRGEGPRFPAAWTRRVRRVTRTTRTRRVHVGSRRPGRRVRRARRAWFAGRRAARWVGRGVEGAWGSARTAAPQASFVPCGSRGTRACSRGSVGG
jgi:hypothetical protein